MTTTWMIVGYKMMSHGEGYVGAGWEIIDFSDSQEQAEKLVAMYSTERRPPLAYYKNAKAVRCEKFP